MKIKQQNNHGAIRKVCQSFSSHLPVLHFVSFTLSPPLCHAQKNKVWNERKEEVKNIKKIAL